MAGNSQADCQYDWDRILRAVRKNKAVLPGVDPYLEGLEKAYSNTTVHRIQRTVLQAASREATQQLQTSLAEGRDAATRLRSFIKSLLGSHSVQLLAYGIKPVGERRPRSKKAQAEAITN